MTLIFWCLLAIFLITGFSSVRIDIVNRCNHTIWPGIQGSTPVENGGFKLNSGQSKSIDVPDRWTAGRIWARTGCNGNMDCETGFCKNNVQCGGAGGRPPASLAEFTLGGWGEQDYYDVSLVDGYNIQVTIEPIKGTYRTIGEKYDCKKAGKCRPNLLLSCPQPLRQLNSQGYTVGCFSACTKFNTDQYCCRGKFNTPQTCKLSNWPVNYPKYFKGNCPTAYSYIYDNKRSTFTCRGSNGRMSPDYRVTFC